MNLQYYLTKSIFFANGTLDIEVVELHKGEPDGYVGLPLTITEKSKKLVLSFIQAGHFKTECETYFLLSRNAVKLSSLIYEEKESEYLSSNRESASFAIIAGTINEPSNVRHYIVYTENYVIHVLAKEEPSLSDRKIEKLA